MRRILTSRPWLDLAALLICAAIILFSARPAAAQVCKPASQRTGEVGCWIIANELIGELPKGAVFWHLYAYPARTAAEAAKGQRGTVVEAHGRFWVLSIELEQWRPAGGERVAAIGPLPVDTAVQYSAHYMEAIFAPGMTSIVHRHPGPEAWYTLAGETCLETPEGRIVGRAGGPPVIVPGGAPMHLTATGTTVRRALVLVLHDTGKPWTIPATDWTPKGLCKVDKPS